MDKNWIQIKGDPAVRGLVFQQERVPSLFDSRSAELIPIVSELLGRRGIFHAKLHFSANQLTCWPYHDPYRYQVWVGEQIFAPEFLASFPRVAAIPRSLIPAGDVVNILRAFERLRLQDESLYLRNASINRINGMIGMTFSCDGAHYIPYRSFYRVVERLRTDAA